MQKVIQPVTTVTTVNNYINIDPDDLKNLANRLIRKYILLQYITAEHPVFQTEEKLVAESAMKIQLMIDEFVKRGWNPKIIQSIVLGGIRGPISMKVHLHDIDNDVAEFASMMACQEAKLIVEKRRPSIH